MSKPHYLTLIMYNICPKCGRRNCPVIAKNPSYQKMREALLKGDEKTVKKLFTSRFAQYTGMSSAKCNETLSKFKANPFNGEPYNSIDLFRLYLDDKGETVSLTQLGLENKVRPLIKKNGAFGRSGENSIESRFIEQFISGERAVFSNAYDFGKESKHPVDPLWAIGSATVKGKIGNLTFLEDNTATAEIDYEFHDRFTDPYDTFNWFEGEWNPNGVPYDIKDRWTNKVKFKYRPKTEEQLLELLKQH